jgi:RNA recognition motif-containing protein
LEKEIEMNIYVGNLSPKTTEDDLRQAFEAFGQVETANVIKDKYSGESKGFGFVEMPSKDEAQKAIDEMNGKDLLGSPINVNEARPRVDRGGGGGRGGYGGGGGRGGGGSRGGGGGGGGGRRRY